MINKSFIPGVLNDREKGPNSTGKVGLAIRFVFGHQSIVPISSGWVEVKPARGRNTYRQHYRDQGL